MGLLCRNVIRHLIQIVQPKLSAENFTSNSLKPPQGKVDWPWMNREIPYMGTGMDDCPFPRISIVTPSYNQADYIEETIRSVLLQGYPNLEYIIMDGGSTDGSVEIIRKYEPWLTRWESRKDAGQAEAINKGFLFSTGEILGWLNSDDLLLPGALFLVARSFLVGKNSWIAGGFKIGTTLASAQSVPYLAPESIEDWLMPWKHKWGITQPSIYWTRELWDNHGPLETQYNFVFDHVLFTKFFSSAKPTIIPEPISFYRLHPRSKTTTQWLRFLFENTSFTISSAKIFVRYPLPIIRQAILRRVQLFFEVRDKTYLIKDIPPKYRPLVAYYLLVYLIFALLRRAGFKGLISQAFFNRR